VKPRLRRLVVGGATASLAALLACDALIGLHDPTEGLQDGFPGPDASADASTDASDARPDRSIATFPDGHGDEPVDFPCAQGLTACGSECVLLSGDVGNCGSCGRVCLGAQCEFGFCMPGQLSPMPEPARGLSAEGATLFVMTDDYVLASTLSTDGGLSLTDLSTVFVLDGGTLRSFAANPDLGGVTVAVAPGDAIVQVRPPLGSPPATITGDAGDPVSVATAFDSTYWASSDPSSPAIMTYKSPGPPAPVAALQPGEGPCSLAASADGVFWTGGRGTWLAPKGGGPPVSITQTPFDHAVAPFGLGEVVVATSDFNLTLFSYSSPFPPEILVQGVAVTAVATAPPVVYYASEGAIYGMLDLGTAVPIATATVPDDCHVPVLATLGPYVFWIDAPTGAVRFVSGLFATAAIAPRHGPSW
jgi:hypothetical protein